MMIRMRNIIKRLLFDYGENFQKQFVLRFKKSAIFLLIIINLIPFTGKSVIIKILFIMCITAFGFIWGKSIIDEFEKEFSEFSFFEKIVLYLICTFSGYILFVLYCIKFMILLIKIRQK